MSDIKQTDGAGDAPVALRLSLSEAGTAPPAGLLGLGALGRGLAKRLAAAGVPLLGADPNPDHVTAARTAGIEVVEPAELGRRCAIVLLALRLGQEEKSWSAMLPEMAPGSLLIDLSPAVPPEARELAAGLAAKGLRLMDAVDLPEPDGLVLAGGAEADLAFATPLLAALGSPLHTGPVGSALAVSALLVELERTPTRAEVQKLLDR